MKCSKFRYGFSFPSASSSSSASLPATKTSPADRAGAPGGASRESRATADPRRPSRTDRRGLNQVGQSLRVFIDRQRTSQDERHRDSADLRGIGPLIEQRRAGRAWQRDTQFPPVAGPRVAKLFERCTKHVLDDDEATGRRDDQPFQRDSAVRDIGRGFLKKAAADTSCRMRQRTALISSGIARFCVSARSVESLSRRRSPT